VTAARLTRKERQERTRAELLAAAARVFARRGLERASVDEVAADAGFTKGAVYANFASKEDLFLAMLDARFAQRLAELDRALSEHEHPDDQARAASADFMQYLKSDPEWEQLFFEAGLHASRNPGFRRRLASHYAQMRGRMAAILARRAEGLGVEPALPVERLTMMFFAMANGVAFSRLVEPGDVPDELLGEMTELVARASLSPAHRAT
jgi:AcrR family transcriptional regulator